MAFDFKKSTDRNAGRSDSFFDDLPDTSHRNNDTGFSFDKFGSNGSGSRQSPSDHFQEDDSFDGFQFPGKKKPKGSDSSNFPGPYTGGRPPQNHGNDHDWSSYPRPRKTGPALGDIPWKTIISLILIVTVILLIVVYRNEILAFLYNLITLLITLIILVILLKILFRRRR